MFFHLSPTVSHLHSVQAENCDSNSRLVLNQDDHGIFRLKRVNKQHLYDQLPWNAAQ